MRVYVLVRSDLTSSQKAVQGGHALAELCHNHDISDWVRNHKTLIYLEVKTKDDILCYFEKLPFEKKSIFIEPDFGNEVTALAVFVDSKVKEFRKLRLM